MKSVLCPKCGKEVEGTSSFPFCSTRCQDADLHGWFSEEYKISRPLSSEEIEEWMLKKEEKLNPYDERYL